jgi:hypothetical protein
MSVIPKALVDCPVCQAPQGHRHSPNCIVVTEVADGMEAKGIIYEELLKFAEDYDRKVFGIKK